VEFSLKIHQIKIKTTKKTCGLAIHRSVLLPNLWNFSKMSILSNTIFDDLLVTPDNANDNLAFLNDVERNNDVSQTDIVILSAIEKGVLNHHEVTVIFENFTDTEVATNPNKVLLSNLFVFVCVISTNIVRRSPKVDQHKRGLKHKFLPRSIE